MKEHSSIINSYLSALYDSYQRHLDHEPKGDYIPGIKEKVIDIDFDMFWMLTQQN